MEMQVFLLYRKVERNFQYSKKALRQNLFTGCKLYAFLRIAAGKKRYTIQKRKDGYGHERFIFRNQKL